MNFRWYGSGFVVLLSILRSAYVARGWTAATSRARAGAGAGAGRGADERSTLRDIWLRETKVDSSNDALLREEDIEAAQIVPKRKGGSRSSRERADNKKRRALERKMATTSFRDERARMLQVRSSENGAGGETEGAFSSPSHSFNRELQHLTRTGKTRPLDGRTPAEQAEELLLDKVKGETAQDSPSSSSSYDTVSFNIVLQAWANQRTMAAALRADNLLSLMHHISSSSIPGNNQTRDSDSVRADAYSYAAVINGYAKSGGKVKAAIRATELLDEFERSSHVAVTSDVCYNAAMNAWAVSGSPQAGERAERILRQLLGMKNVRPTRIAYNACIKAHAKAGQPREAQRLLDQMKMLSTTAHQPQLSPDKITYSSCIDAWSHSCDSSEAAHQAEQLLSEMEEAFATTGDRNVQPDVVSYTSVLAAYAQTGSIHHRKAHELLERMQRYAQDEPNAPFLNAWIHLLAKTSASTRVWTATAESQESAAEEILAFMRSEYTERGCADMKPCKITYTAVITVLAQVGTSTAARRAEELLDELQAKWEETGDANYLPNAKTFASVLNAWAKSGSSSAVESAERLVRRMEDLYERTGSEELEPSLVVYLQVFQALANSRSDESADKAKRLLQKMHNLQLSGFPGVRPDATTYAYLINAFTKSKVDNVAELATVVLTEAEEGYRAGIGSLKPTPLLYSAVLQAYAKISSPEGSRLAEELLSRTKELYQQGKLYAKPTTLFYNAVIDAHARSGGGRAAAERAEALLDELEARASSGDTSLRPRTRTYNAAILAWKNSGGDADAPKRAELLLRRMNNGDNDCKPDRVTLNSIIGVWANSRDEKGAERAERFLRFMEGSSARGEPDLKPDAWTYNSCISAYTRRNRLRDACRVFERMKRRYESGDDELRPNNITIMMLQRALTSSPSVSPQEASIIEVEISRFARATDASS